MTTYVNGYGTKLRFADIIDHQLGLGPDSDFLNAVVQGGLAPSKAFGLWTGSRSISDPVDGALYIGGYDTTRVAGDFIDFPMFDDCPHCVQVMNMTYIHHNGSVSPFAGDDDIFTAVLSPDDTALRVPSQVYNNWMRVSGGKIVTEPIYGEQIITFDNNYALLGNISVTLSNGYQTTIPAQEVFLPLRAWVDSGMYHILNDTFLISEIGNGTFVDGGPVGKSTYAFGMPFFTANYIISDHENKTFKLAPARQGPYGNGNSPLVSSLCTTAALTTTPMTSLKTSTGGIVGAVVGAVAALVIISLLSFFLFRERKKMHNLQLDLNAAVIEISKKNGGEDSKLQVSSFGSQWHYLIPDIKY